MLSPTEERYFVTKDGSYRELDGAQFGLEAGSVISVGIRYRDPKRYGKNDADCWIVPGVKVREHPSESNPKTRIIHVHPFSREINQTIEERIINYLKESVDMHVHIWHR